ncbi:MAG: (deoxy)nucleoside triphosphate pyrophosphohydrolase [bacterium]
MRTSTAAVILRFDRVLVVRRSVGAIAGFWEFPGGKVDPGEEAEDALRRELAEELGVDARVGPEIARAFFTHRGEEYLLRAFRTDPADFRFRLTDHDAVRWVAVPDLDDVNFADSDRKLLPELRRKLSPNR